MGNHLHNGEPPAAKAAKPSAECRPASESQVTLIKDVDAAVCDSKDTLSLGHLLEWMDAASCLAAEKHCGRSAVTLVMDDLDFQDDCCDLLRRGERCILHGKVTRAFGSSMEVVVHVSVAEVRTGSLRSVCDAYFMYVVLKTEEEKSQQLKVEVPKLEPHTIEEHLDYGLAELRRDFRKKRDKQVESLLKPSELRADGDVSPDYHQSGAKVSFTELVLPVHANHMGNTFGGQIMSWMVKGAKTAIWLHLRVSCARESGKDDGRPAHGVGDAPRMTPKELHDVWLRPVSVDTIHFKAPSNVGDRVNVTASISRAFENSIEVAVRVTSNSVGTQDEPKEVNVGYMSFAVHRRNQERDEQVNSRILDVTPSTVEQDEEHRRAVARQEFRELRRQEVRKSSKSNTGSPVRLDPDCNAQELAVQCTSCVLSLQKRRDVWWESLPDDGSGIKGSVDVGLKKPGDISRLKLQTTVKCRPRACYDLLRDVSRRREFDQTCLECANKRPCGPTAELVRMVFAAPQPGSGDKKAKQEVLLLRSYHESPNGYFVVCSRSVCISSESTPAGGDLLPSGYVIEQSPGSGGKSTDITFIGQFNHELFHLVLPHVRGSVQKFREIVEREASDAAASPGGYATEVSS